MGPLCIEFVDELIKAGLLLQAVCPRWSAQQFLSVHSSIYNLFNIQRHLISRSTLRQFRDAAAAEWDDVVRAA